MNLTTPRRRLIRVATPAIVAAVLAVLPGIGLPQALGAERSFLGIQLQPLTGRPGQGLWRVAFDERRGRVGRAGRLASREGRREGRRRGHRV